MDQILMVNLVVEKEGQKFTFSMPMGSKIGLAYDAAFDVLQSLVEMAQQAAKNASPAQQQPADQSSN